MTDRGRRRASKGNAGRRQDTGYHHILHVKRSVTQGACDGSCRVTDKSLMALERKGQEPSITSKMSWQKKNGTHLKHDF
ncbi:hypothetical protein L210DRAFT_3523978 [Boletus edulis BED1]|uniref:Uncharacterized protein n=1 Tax=Boletus edulis BED1 TaxID=1328754 RepID=A0AAD4C6J1_BOLED|nr:hypothetical protein L210DRAFT_3523978 [Boletus edulis BED1]